MPEVAYISAQSHLASESLSIQWSSAGLKLVYFIKKGWSKAGLLRKMEPTTVLVTLMQVCVKTFNINLYITQKGILNPV